MNEDDLRNEVAAVHPGARQRLPMDRYREFRQVFLATDAGRRVLYDIFAAGHMYRSSYQRGDPHHTTFQEGERNLALYIQQTLINEPAMEQPTTQVTRRTGTPNA